MRAHANCLENLPLYTAVVIALLITKATSPWLDVLAVILLVARIAQSTLHIGPKQTELVVVRGSAATLFRSYAWLLWEYGRRWRPVSTRVVRHTRKPSSGIAAKAPRL
jgi:uncharacterized MAPEG superfamily protein